MSTLFKRKRAKLKKTNAEANNVGNAFHGPQSKFVVSETKFKAARPQGAIKLRRVQLRGRTY